LRSGDEEKKKPDLVRHQRDCRVCSHPLRQEIEATYIRWESVSKIARQFGVNRKALHRHIAAFDLLARRNQNIRAILLRIVEKGVVQLGRVSVHDLIAAVTALANIDESGIWTERTQTSNLYQFLPRMTLQELELLIDKAQVPDWVRAEIEKGHSDPSTVN